MTVDENAARLWRTWGSYDARCGRCEVCGRVRDENDQPLAVRKSSARGRWTCLTCYDQPPKRRR